MMDNVKLEMIEAKAGAIIAIGPTNQYSPYVLLALAEEALELAAEVRRLQKVERAVRLHASNHQMWALDAAEKDVNGEVVRYVGGEHMTHKARLHETEQKILENALEGKFWYE